MIKPELLQYGGMLSLGPILILWVAALLGLVGEIVARAASQRKRGLGHLLHMTIAAAGALSATIDAALLLIALNKGSKIVELFAVVGFYDPDQMKPFWSGFTLVADNFAIVMTLAVCSVVLLGIMLLRSHLEQNHLFKPEIYPLLLISGSGMALLGYSRDLLITFIAIEVLSLPLYVLCGLSEKNPAGRESALKYFLLGAFASGFYIYGAALVYGATGHLNFASIQQYLGNSSGMTGLLALGMSLIGVGLAFKVALVPFHAWLPDVYQGAPTPVTAFMAAGVKIGVFCASQRLIYECLVLAGVSTWRDAIAVFAVLSMVVGNLFALHQLSFKRLLAYSAITHTGFLAVGLCAASGSSGTGLLTYLFAYALASVGAFAIIEHISPAGQGDVYIEEMHELSQRAPGLSAMLVVLLLSMAGFPLTAGFIGKLMLFKDAWGTGLYSLVIIAVLNSVVSAYFYLRVVMAMYFQKRLPGGQAANAGRMPRDLGFAAGAVVALTLVLGVLPQFLVDLASNALTKN